MSKKKGVIIGVILIAVLLMAVGYATVSTIELSITANAKASANTENFKVYFTGANTKVSDQTADAIVVEAANEAITATVNFNEALALDTKGETAYAILEIENGSQGIDAESVKVTTSAIDTNIFDFEAVMCNVDGTEITGDNPVASGAKTYVKVSVKLLTSPTDTVNATTTVKLTATPKANV